MKVLITGVAGFIGSNLAKVLLSRGHVVVGIDNLSYGNLRNLSDINSHERFSFILGDVCNPFNIKDIETDIVIHLASQKIPRYSNAYRTLEENALMLRTLIDKCLRDKSKLLFASTSDVYGKNTELPFSENSNLVLGPTTVKRWAYALSKMYGEQQIIAHHQEFGLNYTIVRFFGSYGPNQNLTWWGGPQSLFITKAFGKEAMDIHGDGAQTRTFTYIEDTVSALVLCIESERSNGEIYNIASNPNEEISILDLGKLIWELVNGNHSAPKFNVVPYSSFGKYEDVPRRVPCIDKIKDHLRFEPRFCLRDGLERTIEWQKKIEHR